MWSPRYLAWRDRSPPMFNPGTCGVRNSVVPAVASLMCAVAVKSVPLAELLSRCRCPRITKACEAVKEVCDLRGGPFSDHQGVMGRARELVVLDVRSEFANLVSHGVGE